MVLKGEYDDVHSWSQRMLASILVHHKEVVVQAHQQRSGYFSPEYFIPFPSISRIKQIKFVNLAGYETHPGGCKAIAIMKRYDVVRNEQGALKF